MTKERTAIVEKVMMTEKSSVFITVSRASLTIELGGIPGDRHFGMMRPANVRQPWYPRGTLIANRRQISIVSLEECKRIADKLGVPEIKPEWLGANICFAGMEGLTLLPMGSRLIFPDGVGLICEGENLPCTGPGKVIAQQYKQEGLAAQFVKEAKSLRGIVCSVEKEGEIHTGDQVRIF